MSVTRRIRYKAVGGSDEATILKEYMQFSSLLLTNFDRNSNLFFLWRYLIAKTVHNFGNNMIFVPIINELKFLETTGNSCSR